ncbi:divergent PAP2 family protein [bacterium]|nr:divergent PAP2 family protein [bacterium]
MRDFFIGLFANKVLIAALLSALVATLLKVVTGKWSKAEVSRTLAYGGMPSSHSAFASGATWAIGMMNGFDSPLFGLSVAWTVLVVFDALGLRRAAGDHAKHINTLWQDLSARKPGKDIIKDVRQLQEVLGHTPLEVTMGILAGILTAVATVKYWPLPLS